MRATSRRVAMRSPPVVGRAEKSTLQDNAYAKLRDAIMFGKLVPGEKVSIRSLAYQLGTSAIPVREALRRLAAERAIEVLPKGSIAVPAMTPDRFRDLRRTRLLVEGFAVELAGGRLSQADFRRMEAASNQRDTAVRAGNMRSALHSAQRFRFTIYQAAGSETLMPIIESLWLQVGPFFNFALVDPMQAVSTRFQHMILDALKRGDGAAARALVERDIMEVGDLILEALEDAASN